MSTSLPQLPRLRRHTDILDAGERRSAPQLIHPLHTNALRLLDEKPRNDDDNNTEAAVDEVGAVAVGADSVEHDWGRAGDDEVEEPVNERSE